MGEREKNILYSIEGEIGSEVRDGRGGVEIGERLKTKTSNDERRSASCLIHFFFLFFFFYFTYLLLLALSFLPRFSHVYSSFFFSFFFLGIRIKGWWEAGTGFF